MYTWNFTQTSDSSLYSATRTVNDIESLKKAIENSAEKAIELLPESINDNSLYFLCEWITAENALNIVITDATKSVDSSIAVKSFLQFNCSENEVATSLYATTEELIDAIHFFLHDYLTTATSFFNYSLVAIFHSSDRNNTILL